MPEACTLGGLILYADDTTVVVWGNSLDDLLQRVVEVASQILDYMASNRLASNPEKTQFIIFGGGEQRNVSIGGAVIAPNSCVTFLGLKLSRQLRWTEHVQEMEAELAKRTGVLHRLRQHIPQKALLSIMNGFFLSKATYLLDIVSDSTGEEPGTVTTVKKLQTRLNEAIRTVLKVPRKNCVSSKVLHLKTGLPSIEDLAVRADSSLAWRLLAQGGDLRGLAESRLRLQDHRYATRSSQAGRLIQEDAFPSFIKKSAAIFNCFDNELKDKENKFQAKTYIKKNLTSIKRSLKCL